MILLALLAGFFQTMNTAHDFLSPQMIESTLELMSQIVPSRTDALNRSSALEAYDCVKRTLQVRLIGTSIPILLPPFRPNKY
jgi:hypothetical protein